MIELQQKLLGDSLRNNAFFDALKKVVKRGETVVADVGSGTGFLSFLASKLGARMCYLCESNADLLDLSEALAKRNGIRNCRFIQGHSTKIKLPEKVDLLISETLGNFALEENIIETVEDAKRFLKPHGVIMPSSIRQFVLPVTSSRLYREIDVWKRIGFDLDFDRARAAALNNMYVYPTMPGDLMQRNGAQQWDAVDFSKKNKSIRSGSGLWKIKSAVTCYGFAVWWEAVLAPGIVFSTSPFAKKTHWDQIFLPLVRPLRIEKGETLEMRLSSDSRYEVGINVAWEARRISSKDGLPERVAMDMQKGFLYDGAIFPGMGK